jgi:hypothetical protein
MASAKRKSKGKTLIASMDRFAAELLKHAEVAEGLADKIAAGAMVAKWIAIKHRLGTGMTMRVWCLRASDLGSGVRLLTEGRNLGALPGGRSSMRWAVGSVLRKVGPG